MRDKCVVWYLEVNEIQKNNRDIMIYPEKSTKYMSLRSIHRRKAIGRIKYTFSCAASSICFGDYFKSSHYHPRFTFMILTSDSAVRANVQPTLPGEPPVNKYRTF